MTPIAYVGMAYIAIWIGVLAFVVRLAATSSQLDRRISDLERTRRS